MELNICKEPPIIYAIYGGVRLAIILGQKSSNAEKWFYNNHIQLYSSKLILSHGGVDHLVQFLSFKDNTYRLFLDETIINEDINSNLNRTNILDFIMHMISEKYYIHAYVDVSKIKGLNYSGKPMAHSLFIVGYDLEKLQLCCWDYNLKGQFCKIRISINDFLDAFTSCDAGKDLNKKGLANKYYFKLYKFRDRTYHFSVDYMVEQIQAYLSSRDISYYSEPMIYGENIKFGISCWDNVDHYFKENNDIIDERLLKVILEHKHVMKNRISYLLENNYLYNHRFIRRFCELEQMASKIQILGLKYNINHNGKSIDEIRTIINTMVEFEGKIFNDLICSLK